MYRIHVMEIHKAFGKQIWTEAYETEDQAKERQAELNATDNVFVIEPAPINVSCSVLNSNTVAKEFPLTLKTILPLVSKIGNKF